MNTLLQKWRTGIKIPKKSSEWVYLSSQVGIIVFFLWFYGNLYYRFSIGTHSLLFTAFPVLMAVGFYFILSVPCVYAFMLGFLVQWILFLYVNPYPLENDNKYTIMHYIPEKYKPEQEYLLQDLKIEDLEKMKYPIILKPLVCSGGGKEIYILESYADYVEIMKEDGNKIDLSQYMVQRFMDDYEVEIGVVYERKPWEKTGRIMEIVEKTQKDKIRPFVLNFIENRHDYITPKTSKLIDELSKKIPGFYVGRYDIRLKKMEDLEKGDFKIVEVNGTMGMYLSSDDNLLNYQDVLIDVTWYLTRLQIGAYNLFTGNGYSPLNMIRAFWTSIKHGLGCNDWENIFSLYS